MEERKQLLDHSMTNWILKKVLELANDYQNRVAIIVTTMVGPTSTRNLED